MKMEPIEGSETSAFRTQTPGNYPKENIRHKEHGESLKSRNVHILLLWYFEDRGTKFLRDDGEIEDYLHKRHQKLKLMTAGYSETSVPIHHTT